MVPCLAAAARGWRASVSSCLSRSARSTPTNSCRRDGQIDAGQHRRAPNAQRDTGELDGVHGARWQALDRPHRVRSASSPGSVLPAGSVSVTPTMGTCATARRCLTFALPPGPWPGCCRSAGAPLCSEVVLEGSYIRGTGFGVVHHRKLKPLVAHLPQARRHIAEYRLGRGHRSTFKSLPQFGDPRVHLAQRHEEFVHVLPVVLLFAGSHSASAAVSAVA